MIERDVTTEDWATRYKRACREAVGRPCDACGRQIRDPWVVYVSPSALPTGYVGEYCARSCGGSWFI